MKTAKWCNENLNSGALNIGAMLGEQKKSPRLCSSGTGGSYARSWLTWRISAFVCWSRKRV